MLEEIGWKNSNQGNECKIYIKESIFGCISLICIEQTLDKVWKIPSQFKIPFLIYQVSFF